MSFFRDIEHQPTLSPLQEVSRFDAYFDVFGLSLKRGSDAAQKTITLIARSPSSPAAQALAVNLRRFEPGSIAVGIVFAQIAPADALEFLGQALDFAESPPLVTVVRWAKNRALLDAHERLTLGRTLCWTGDSMRRAEDARSGIDRVDDANPLMLAEAHASFSALWKASKPVPVAVFSRASGSFTDAAALASRSIPSDAHLDRNVVRLEDYLRQRRH